MRKTKSGGILMKAKKIFVRILAVLAVTVLILIAVFIAGRYGWRLGGFSACQSAGIRSAECDGQNGYIEGFYPGSFPEGFCGYYSEERDGKLYIGFRFSGVFGFFETGNFDITVPIKGDIDEVIIKTASNEHSVWRSQNGFLSDFEG